MRKITDFIRVGRWLLCRFFSPALRLLNAHHKSEPAREHCLDRGDARLVFLSTQPVILKPSYSELIAPVRDLPRDITTTELEDAIHKLQLVKSGSPAVFPVDIYLSQFESTRGLSRCVQSGISSTRLALELTGHTEQDEATNHFVVHFCRRD